MSRAIGAIFGRRFPQSAARVVFSTKAADFHTVKPGASAGTTAGTAAGAAGAAAGAGSPASQTASIDTTISELKHRIETDSENLEKTLEKLSKPPEKLTLQHFKYPMVNAFLLASIVYYLMEYTWGYLNYEAEEAEFKKEISELEQRVEHLERLAAAPAAAQTASGGLWQKLAFWK